MATLETQQNERRDMARRALDEYRVMCSINDHLLTLVERCDSRAASVTAQLGEMRSSNEVHSSLEEAVVELDDLSAKMERYRGSMARAMDNVLELIVIVGQTNEVASKVLTERYLVDGRKPTMDDIASKLNYSPQYIREVHTLGLDMVADILC